MSESPYVMQMAGVVRAFLESRFRSALSGRAVTDEEPLFSSGMIDSFGVLELIAFLEDSFHVTIDTAQHDLKEFDSIAKICRLLEGLGARRP